MMGKLGEGDDVRWGSYGEHAGASWKGGIIEAWLLAANGWGLGGEVDDVRCGIITYDGL